MADKVSKGTKIEAADAKKLDVKKQGHGRPTPPKAGEVEGQASYLQLVICPWCGAGNWCVLDTQFYTHFRCWNCGLPFKA